ncbi:unnamed protein product [Brachionus calyciflorus]|uniref:MULE transposase domain-containing protein n=1 Tax=Brachionus calyciflorus TaxID=104777 RepID=A0A813TG15_9BILA|nr:unnamed protein product [Brachionus calyciflorus]
MNRRPKNIINYKTTRTYRKRIALEESKEEPIVIKKSKSTLLNDSLDDIDDDLKVKDTQVTFSMSIKNGPGDLAKSGAPEMWCIDGKFDISPSLFKQLFTINVLLNGRNLPLLYAFLVDKSEKTYRRLFNFIKEFVYCDFEYIFCDFEKGILNAVEFFFSKSQISGCWFHLASNLYKHIQQNGLVSTYRNHSESLLRKCFQYIKLLAFIPPKDVIFGFEMIKQMSPSKLIPILDYFEKYYIGVPVKNDSTKRVIPLFQIKYWNLYKRICKELTRTNNNIEAWHKSLSQDIESHPTIFKLLKHLRREQRMTEQLFDEIKSGRIFQRSKKEVKKDQNIKLHLENYNKENLVEFFDKLILILKDKKDKNSIKGKVEEEEISD